jgi:hypothetical protein
MILKKICTLSVLCLFLAVLPVWGLDFNPGKYEITVRMEMPGIPGGVPPQTMTQCLTDQNPVPDSSPDAQGCKMTDMRTTGNTVTYTIDCNQQGVEAKITGDMTYKGDSFEGTTLTDMGPETGGMTIMTVVKGKRIGKCD